VRARVPILVDATVMASAGLMPEQDLSSQSSPASRGQLQAPPSGSDITPPPTPRPISGEETSRLSIFEDFLSKLDDQPKDDTPDQPDEPDKP
jgi:hypothetical protein